MGYAAYPSYRDSHDRWLGKIPTHWKTKPLKFAAKVQPSNVDKKTEDSEVPVELCNYVDVYKNEAITDDLSFMKATATTEEITKFRVEAGDVIVTKDSETAEDIAVPAYVPKPLDNVVCGYHLTQIKPHLVEGSYLFRLFQSSAFNKQFVVGANGVTRFGLPQHAINDALVCIPEPVEQQAIARFLDHKTAQIDALIAKKQALLQKLAEKRTALISHAVTKGLERSAPMKDSGVNWLGEIPKHWRIVPFKWCCRITEGQVDPTDPAFSSLPLIAPNHIEGGTGVLLDTESAENQGAISGKYYFHRGAVLYSKIRPALVKACIAEFDGLCSADMYPIYPLPGLLPEFLLFQILSKGFTQFALLVSDRVAMPKVNREALGNFMIAVPPEQEQQQIIDSVRCTVARLDKQISKSVDAIGKLKEYRSALITAAVTGKIDVRDVPIPEAARP